jgi:hypothetical protein
MQTAIKKHTIDAILGLPRLEDGGGGDGPARGGTALPPVLADREPEGKFRHLSEINAVLNYYTVDILYVFYAIRNIKSCIAIFSFVSHTGEICAEIGYSAPILMRTCLITMVSIYAANVKTYV